MWKLIFKFGFLLSDSKILKVKYFYIHLYVCIYIYVKTAQADRILQLDSSYSNDWFSYLLC